MMLSVLSALAEPTRLQAVCLLADGSEHCVCELMQKLGATQSRMSRHMQVLRGAGLVLDRRDAQWVRYRLNPEMAREVRAVLDAVICAERASAPARRGGREVA
ncbi:ArsR/SmtB family transcription factor [Rhodobacter lacus]|uniref:ArsR/SmtB family transcription factor n=1 Tax=Rhodobacter lacus TaxID=1641972 RepID=A0ABW5ABW8_9RHOB